MDNNTFDLQKALDTSTTNNNNVLDPVLLSKIIVDQVRRVPALRNIIKREDWDSNIYAWDTVIDHGLAQTATDGATLSFVDPVFNPQGISKMSYFYHLSSITNPAIQAARALVNLVEFRLNGAMKQLLRKEGQTLYSGDPVNATNPGLFNVLSQSATFGYVGGGNTLSGALLSQIDISLRANGYEPGVFVCSPGIYSILEQAAYDRVRFVPGITPSDSVNIGYSFSPLKALSFNGIPVVMDVYAATPTVASTQTLAGSGTTYSFPNANVYTSAGQNYAGTAWVAPVIQVSGATVPASAYSFSGQSVVFNTAPSAQPTATYTYGTENIYCLSLDPQDLIIAEQMAPTVEMDLAKPAQQDSIPLRVKEYSVLVVRNPLAHVLASNIVLPKTPFAGNNF